MSASLRHPLLAATLALASALAVPAPSAAQEPAPAAHDPRILPGDVVRLQVWREPGWDGDYVVDQFGIVALPLVGDVDTRGQTQRSLRARLREAYAAEVRDLSFQLLVLKRVRVTGEVRVPGIYAVEPTQGVADALVLAGGRSPDGVRGEVILRRAGQETTVALGDGSRLSSMPVETGDELFVRTRSWISRNLVAVLGSGIGLLGVTLALLR